jgi:ABC-type Zn uptake system ZnuABC Zn-binding protein ZnuA
MFLSLIITYNGKTMITFEKKPTKKICGPRRAREVTVLQKQHKELHNFQCSPYILSAMRQGELVVCMGDKSGLGAGSTE